MITKRETHLKWIRRSVGILFALGALVFLGLKIFNHPQETAELFSESNKYLIALIVIIQALSFVLNAFLSRQLLAFLGHKTAFRNNLKVAVANEFGNWVMPIAGGSITSYVVYRRIKIPPSVVVFMETAWTGLNLSQNILFFTISVLLIPPHYLALVPKLALSLFGVGIIVLGIVWYSLMQKKGRNILKKFVTKFIGFLKILLPLPMSAAEVGNKIEEGSKDILKNFALFFSKPKKALFIFLISSTYFVADVTMLNLAFRAFGVYLSPTLTVFGFVVSMLVSLVTLFPGNPGVTEASLSLIFSALGVPLHAAIISVVLFRIATYWIWIPLSTYIVFNKHSAQANVNTV